MKYSSVLHCVRAEGGETPKQEPCVLEFVFKGWNGPQGSIV